MEKKPKEVGHKWKKVFHVLITEEWFTLDIEPNYLIQEFTSLVRVQVLNGSELLSYESIKTFIDVDRRVRKCP